MHLATAEVQELSSIELPAAMSAGTGAMPFVSRIMLDEESAVCAAAGKLADGAALESVPATGLVAEDWLANWPITEGVLPCRHCSNWF